MESDQQEVTTPTEEAGAGVSHRLHYRAVKNACTCTVFSTRRIFYCTICTCNKLTVLLLEPVMYIENSLLYTVHWPIVTLNLLTVTLV